MISLVKFLPVLGIIGGVAILIAGHTNDNTVLTLVGFVLIGSGLFRQFQK
jgi:hypothetical protein